MVAANARTVISFSLSGGQAHDAPEGRKLLRTLQNGNMKPFLLMDRAYEGDATRCLAVELGYDPVVPPKRNRINPWEYNQDIYKRRNEIERLFRRLKGFRRIATRFDKLDALFAGFIVFCLVVEALR
jgi:transposase